MRPGSRLRRVREGELGVEDDAVRPHEQDRHLSRLPNPRPASPELRDVRHHAQHGLLTPEHGLRLDVAEPHLQVGREVLAGQFQHGDVAAAVQLREQKREVITLSEEGSLIGTRINKSSVIILVNEAVEPRIRTYIVEVTGFENSTNVHIVQ